MLDGRKRINVQPGVRVRIVEKHNQKSGLLTEGTVEAILTNSPEHPHGIKVRLKERSAVGRVKEVLVADTNPLNQKRDERPRKSGEQ